MAFAFGTRQGIYLDSKECLAAETMPLTDKEIEESESFDLIYRCLCAALFNYVPASGHPGRFAPDQVAGFKRNRRPTSSGLGGRFHRNRQLRHREKDFCLIILI